MAVGAAFLGTSWASNEDMSERVWPYSAAGSGFQNGRPSSTIIPPRSRSIYPRFSQISLEYCSAPESPNTSSQASQASLYKSALDFVETNPMADGPKDKDQISNYSIPLMDKGTEGFPPFRVSSQPNADQYFKDGQRKIDFVLAYTTESPDEGPNSEARKIFEENLRLEGLELENEIQKDLKVNFVKIHAPMDVLTRFAEIMKLKMPMKPLEHLPKSNPPSISLQPFHPAFYRSIAIEDLESEFNATQATIQHTCFQKLSQPFAVDHRIFPPRTKCITTEFNRNKEFLFDIPENKDDFFSSAVRSRIVEFILKRKPFSRNTDSKFDFGISRLLADEVYCACYPLHEGDGNSSNGNDLRSLLRREWASVRKMHKMQPLDYIKEYFGVKIGLYFAWLGFYTYMLIPASIVGFICFIYGLATMYSNVPSQDVCDKALNIVMCPICDKCNYWKLEETCTHSHITYLADNSAVVIFAVFMSFWGALFLEMWKRYSAQITYNWDLTVLDQSEEHPRPEYLVRLSSSPTAKKKMNFITQTMEPYISFWKRKFPAIVMSASVVLLLTCIALAAVIGVIIYRMSVSAALSIQYDSQSVNSLIERNAPIITTATAAVINLLFILILNQVYTKVAEYLTELELPRTQSDYDNSLTLKMFLLQFVNYYASIFYIAFFKGKMIGYPGNYERIFGYRQEECGPGGCLLELAIQLAIIMVGKQALNALMEMTKPVLFKWYNVCKNKFNPNGTTEKELRSWEKDFQLVDMGAQGLFWEYLEMVLQFGFVTIFVSAFPLAPLFALLNNSFEMRLDGKKFLNLFRRPVARRVPNIGVWYRIMDCIGKLSVTTNAFIIAFTSQFIPRLVYKYRVSPDGSLDGYVNYSLSYFSVNDYGSKYRPQESDLSENLQYCRYEDYREYPSDNGEHTYDHTKYFWYVMTVRLAFVVVFQSVVMLSVTMLRWLVPDTPKNIRDKMKRDIYLTNEIMVEHESVRAQGLSTVVRRNVADASTTTEDNGPNPPKGVTFRPNLESESFV